MPRKKPTGPKPMLTVFLSAYADEEIKERMERGGVFTNQDEIVTSVVYLGTSERAAGYALYRAMEAATTNLLAFEVVIWKGNITIARVRVEH